MLLGFLETGWCLEDNEYNYERYSGLGLLTANAWLQEAKVPGEHGNHRCYCRSVEEGFGSFAVA